MGFSRAACAVSGLPIESEALGFLVSRRAGGRWEPFSVPTRVVLDEYQRLVEFEDPSVLLVLAGLLPDAESLLGELRDARVGGVSWRLGALELAYALVEPAIATALTREVGPRLPGHAGELRVLAFPQPGVRDAHAAAPKQGLALCAALRLLSLELAPFGSFGDVTPGHDAAELAPHFDRAAKRFAQLPKLGAAVAGLRQLWEHDDGQALDEEALEPAAEEEPDEEEDEPGQDLSFTRTFTGVWTVTVRRRLAGELAVAVEARSQWQRLDTSAVADAEALSAMVRDAGPKHVLTLSDGARAALVAALRAGQEWVSDEGEVIFRVQ